MPKTTGLIVKDSHVIHETADVLSDPERGPAMRAAGPAAGRVALWRTRPESLRSEFVRVPLMFIEKNNSAMMSSEQG